MLHREIAQRRASRDSGEKAARRDVRMRPWKDVHFSIRIAGKLTQIPELAGAFDALETQRIDQLPFGNKSLAMPNFKLY